MSMIIANNSQILRANANLRCFACLSIDRNLKPLKQMSLMAVVCPEIFLNATITTHYLICWECQAIVVKINAFKAKVVKAQSLLKRTVKVGSIFSQGLTNLKKTGIESITISPNNTIVPMVIDELAPENIKTEETTVKVKKEKSDDYDDYDENIQQINDLQMGSGESTDTASETEMAASDCDPCSSKYPVRNQVKCKKVDTEIDFDTPAKKVKGTFQPPKLKINIKPLNAYINTLRDTLTPRGTKEQVKVTVGIPNTDVTNVDVPKKAFTKKVVPKKDVPKKDVPKKDVPKKDVPKKDVLKKVVLKKIVPKKIVSNTSVSKVGLSNIGIRNEAVPNVVQVDNEEIKLGLYGYEDIEVKCKLVNRYEMHLYREGKKKHHIFSAARYKCVKCLERFNSQENLDAHNKKHDVEQGNSICEICEQRFPERSMRDMHYKSHFIIYECLSCAWQSHDRINISEHIRRKHQISNFNCNKCDAVFKTYKEQFRHKAKEHYRKPACTECGKKFSSRNALRDHMPIHTGEVFECTICKKKIKKSRQQTHRRYHNNKEEEAAYCVTCGTYYKNKASYTAHLKLSLKHNPIEKLGLKCDHCGKWFGSKNTLTDHIEIEHTLSPEVKCDICKKEFKCKKRLVRHIKHTHERKKRKCVRMCEICGKSYNGKAALNDHRNTHLGLRPFQCQDCGDTFSYKSSLYTHRKLVHKVKKKSEREKAEKEEREKAEKEAREKAEKDEREKAEKEAREKAEKDEREKAEKEAREKAEKEEREKAEKK